MTHGGTFLRMAEARSSRYPTVPDPESMPRPVPNLATVYRVERILIDANRRGEDPITLDEIRRRLGTKGVRAVTVKTCAEELERQGKVALTADGVLWTWLSPAAMDWVRSRKWVE